MKISRGVILILFLLLIQYTIWCYVCRKIFLIRTVEFHPIVKFCHHHQF